jgi:tetratricopeptide (TPR) repeat protein
VAAVAVAAVLWCAACGPERVTGQARAEMTPAEQELLDTYRTDNLLTSRRLAEAILADDPDSLVANYVFGAVLRRAEGDLPSAMRSLDRARALYENTWPVAPAPESAPWRLHREILMDIQEVAQELEEHAYRLSVIEYYNALYQPDLHSQRAWALLQLGRYEEARVAARTAIESADPIEQTLGYNAACALSARTLDRAQRRDDCAGAFDVATRRARVADATDVHRSVNVAVHAYNAAHGALGAGEVETALRLLEQGSARLAFTPANPWRLRTLIELGRARGNVAADALVEMDRWRRRQPPWMRDQDRAETDGVFALAMSVFGYPDEARVAIDRAIQRPDRRGLVSTAASAQIGRHLLLRRSIREQQRVREAELAPFGFETSRLDGMFERIERWQDDRRIVASVASGDTLERTLMPWIEGGLGLPPWMAPDVLDVVGRGVARTALDRAKRADDPAQFPGYWTLLEAEWSLLARRWNDAADQAQAAWDALAEDDAMLRGRTAAVAHLAHTQRGDDAAARTWLNAALQSDPSIVRRRNLALPVAFQAQGRWGATVREALRAGPRFRASNEGWALRIESDDDTIRACLEMPRVGAAPCTEVTRDEDETDEAMLIRFADLFHRDAFSLPLQGSTVDLRSLDGGTSFDAATARENLRDSLDRAMESRGVRRKPEQRPERP